MIGRIAWEKEVLGRIKSVEGTRVVTMFHALGPFPIRPIQSYFLKMQDPELWSVEPLLRHDDNGDPLQAYPLRSIDRVSLAMAYARWALGLMLTAIIPLLFILIHHLSGDPLPDGGGLATRLLVSALAIGVVGGALSYLFPRVPDRERRIRTHCGECLGMAADPALVWLHWASEIIETLKRRPVTPGTPRRAMLIRDLTVTRARLALADDPRALEERTDRLLDELEVLDRRGS